MLTKEDGSYYGIVTIQEGVPRHPAGVGDPGLVLEAVLVSESFSQCRFEVRQLDMFVSLIYLF